MSEIDANGYGAPELGPEITGTLLVAGRPTGNKRIYSMKLLQRIASNQRIQKSIRTLTFCGKVRSSDVYGTGPMHTVTYLGVEGRELRVATRLLPFSFADRLVMNLLPDAHRAGTVMFTPLGTGSVDENGVVGVSYELNRIDLVVLEKHDVKLPERYVPKALGMESEQVDTVRPILYGIGIEYRPNDFGMTHGLAADVKEMLEVVPDSTFEPSHGERVCLLRFNSDGTDQVLYVWRDQAWEKEC